MCEIHALVQDALAKGSLAEKTNRDLSRLECLGRKGRARSDSYAATDDGVRAQITSGRIGDVHRTAFPAAVTSFLAEQLGKHSLR